MKVSFRAGITTLGNLCCPWAENLKLWAHTVFSPLSLTQLGASILSHDTCYFKKCSKVCYTWRPCTLPLVTISFGASKDGTLWISLLHQSWIFSAHFITNTFKYWWITERIPEETPDLIQKAYLLVSVPLEALQLAKSG
jgi:hypothetical protein